MRRRWLLISIAGAVAFLVLALVIPKPPDEFAFLRRLKPDETEYWVTSPGGKSYYVRLFRFRESTDVIKKLVESDLKGYTRGGFFVAGAGSLYEFNGPDGRSVTVTNMSSAGTPTLRELAWIPMSSLEVHDLGPSWLERTWGRVRGWVGL